MPQGKYEDAIAEYARHSELVGMPNEEIAKGRDLMTKAYKTGGATGYWATLASLMMERKKIDPENGPPYFAIGYVFARSGDTDKAFEYFEKSFEQREPDILRLQGSRLESLHPDPRYQDLIRRIGFPR